MTRQINIADGLRVSAFRSPAKTAVIQADHALTFRELDRRANQVANALLGLGFAPGDRVGILLANVPEYVELYFGLARAGLVAVPMSFRLVGPEIAFQLNDSGARMVIYANDYDAQVEAARAEAHGVERWLAVGEPYEQLLAAAADSPPSVVVDEHQPFFIGYTSGTTGLPKGAVVSHRSRSLTFFGMAEEYGCYSAEDVGLATAPLYHGAGMAFALATVYFGGTISLLKAFQPEELLRRIAHERITNAFMVPTMFQAVFGLPEPTRRQYDLSGFSTWMSNAAPLAQATKELIVAEWPHTRLFEIYGSTEGGIVTSLRPQDQLRKVQCVGQPFPMTDIKLLDGEGVEVPVGEVGELFSRSPYLFDGYHGQSAATLESFHGEFFSAGDLAVRDDENHFYIVDRKKDMILSGGINVYPREVEEVLFRHPNVADVAVIGVPDAYWGESVTAVVVARPGLSVTDQDVVAFCEGKLASFKHPRSVVFADQLPRNAAGKVLKRVLRETYR
ncbi:MAG TPA: AMP-binding protein [Chloroflexota bacterium]|jgi:acyl-CoA synthetase (AMP-forming)/AMP-acid ligase II